MNLNKKIYMYGAMFIIAIILLGTKSIYIPLIIVGIISLIFLYRFFGVIITILIAINESIFYLIPKADIPSELGVVIITITLLLIFLFEKCNIKDLYFGKVIILIIFIPIISTITSNILNNQSIFMGIMASKRYFIYIIYFYVMSNLKKEKDIERLKNILVYTGLILSILFIFQAVGILNIFNVKLMPMRSSMLRFFDGYILIMFSYLISFSSIFDKLISNKKSVFYLTVSAIEFISIVLVSQTRNFIISILITSVVVIIFQKKYKKWLLISIGMFIILVSILVNIDINIGLTSLLDSLIYDLKNKVGTVGFRIRELAFYMDSFLKNMLSGMGYYNDRFYGYEYITGLNQLFYTNDVGMIGYIFHTGCIGIAIFIILIVKLFKIFVSLRNNNINGYLIAMSLLAFIMSGMVSTFYIDDINSILYIGIMLAIIEYYYKQLMKGVEEKV